MEEMEKSRIGQFEVRTDLALEERESFEGDGGEDVYKRQELQYTKKSYDFKARLSLFYILILR